MYTKQKITATLLPITKALKPNQSKLKTTTTVSNYSTRTKEVKQSKRNKYKTPKQNYTYTTTQQYINTNSRINNSQTIKTNLQLNKNKTKSTRNTIIVINKTAPS